MNVPDNPGVRLEGSRRGLSRLSLTVFGLLFAAGLAKGAVAYARRAPGIERHAAGTNSITVELVLAAAAAAVVIGIQVRRSRQPVSRRGPSPWAAPFSVAAASRVLRTLRLAGGPSPLNLARFIIVLPVVLLVLYVPFRMGAQITGGLDPNATVNAWGGPGYLGALLAHWLDAIVGFYAAAFALSRLARTDHPNGPGVTSAAPDLDLSLGKAMPVLCESAICSCERPSHDAGTSRRSCRRP